eukprot:CAMPEP_0198286676 /NCGR_PEP_ID=MMETSP1449-20131203/5689_1 /TAXON_ID=420275 /ORGANISM="Attheya septentrionalis, Strain CCMP2084" /LENGTH=188 /DNA_ID=CAMNT_0043984461 /DNA_START=138 /DNA_END=704 /DNA_ORIENTATION=-
MSVLLRRGAIVTTHPLSWRRPYSSRVRRLPLGTVRLLHSGGGAPPQGVAFFSSERSDIGDKSDPAAVSAVAASAQWRKKQLDQITDKFSDKDNDDDEEQEEEEEEKSDVELDSEGIPIIKSDEDVQEMWRAMESRVTKRTSLTLAERGGKIGRRNIRKTEEDEWLQAGLYDIHDDEEEDPAPQDSNAK